MSSGIPFNNSTKICLSVIYTLHDLHFCLVITKDTHIQCQRLKLFKKYLEGFRNTRLRNIITLNDRLIGLHTAYHIIRLHCKDLLQCVGCTICLKCPYLHLSETLSTKLSFTTQRLLCNQGVWTSRTCMDLIVNQMMQFQVVHVTDSGRTVKRLSCTSVTKLYLTISGDRNTFPECSVIFILIQILHNIRSKYIFVFLTELFKILCIYIVICKFQRILDIFLVCTIKYRC